MTSPVSSWPLPRTVSGWESAEPKPLSCHQRTRPNDRHISFSYVRTLQFPFGASFLCSHFTCLTCHLVSFLRHVLGSTSQPPSPLHMASHLPWSELLSPLHPTPWSPMYLSQSREPYLWATPTPHTRFPEMICNSHRDEHFYLRYAPSPSLKTKFYWKNRLYYL